MLNFFRYLGTVGLAVILLLVALSVIVQNFWCRFLCPYGALMGIVSALSPGNNPARRGGVHRLRQVQQGMSFTVASGQAGADPVC